MGIRFLISSLFCIVTTFAFGQGVFGEEETWSTYELWDYYYTVDGNFFGDVTGDGKADHVFVKNEAIYVRRSDGEHFLLAAEEWFSPTSGLWATNLADVNGDGMDDIVATHQDGAYVYLSTGNSFSERATWLNEPFGFQLDSKSWIVDVNGDGLADMVRYWSVGNGVKVNISTGAAFTTPYSIWTVDPVTYFESYYMADVNGDGKADAINPRGNINPKVDYEISVRLSTGTSFLSNQTWLKAKNYGQRTLGFYDFTGDLKADWIEVEGNRSGVIKRSTGYDYSLPYEQWGGELFGNGNLEQNFFADVTGDGKSDLIELNTELGIIIVRRAIECDNTITLSNVVNKPITIIRATNSIRFLPGAVISSDVYFSAKIEACLPLSARVAKQYEYSSQINALDSLGLESINDGSEISVYPNPVHDFLIITINCEEASAALLEISNVNYQVITMESYTLMKGLNKLRLNMKGVKSGVYILNFKYGTQRITKKILVK